MKGSQVCRFVGCFTDDTLKEDGARMIRAGNVSVLEATNRCFSYFPTRETLLFGISPPAPTDDGSSGRTFSVLSSYLKKLRRHNKSAIELLNVNPARGHKEVRRSRGHIMVTARYSNSRGSKSRQTPCQIQTSDSIKTLSASRRCLWVRSIVSTV